MTTWTPSLGSSLLLKLQRGHLLYAGHMYVVSANNKAILVSPICRHHSQRPLCQCLLLRGTPSLLLGPSGHEPSFLATAVDTEMLLWLSFKCSPKAHVVKGLLPRVTYEEAVEPSGSAAYLEVFRSLGWKPAPCTCLPSTLTMQ